MTIQKHDSEDQSSPKMPPLKPGNLLVYVMAVACGMAVANLYYAQPLLHTLAQRFGTSEGTTGLIVTMTQLGYVIGLALIVPLGDLLERRRLITVVSAGTAVALAGAAISPGIGSFLSACLAIGFTAVVAQVLVPFAAALAADEQRGAVIGRVMAGLLLGILLARTVSGFIADAYGWRQSACSFNPPCCGGCCRRARAKLVCAIRP